LLERQGLVAIAVGKDQRTRVISLTAAGQQALARAAPLWERAQSHMVAGLGETRWRALLAELSAVVSLARQD
jgi:DNA-binding MarR family transcriptional regulator